MARKPRTTQTPQTAIGYVRVSTDEQDLSVAAQKDALMTWCATRGITLLAVFEDNVTGGTKRKGKSLDLMDTLQHRPGLLAALDALDKGMVLVATKRDRLARDRVAMAMIERLVERAGARLQTVDGTGDGDTPEAQLLRGINDLFAEYKRQVIRARIRVALGHKQTKNERISRHIPYGKTLAADGVHLEDHPGEQAVMAVARALHSAGLSSRQVAAGLAARGLYSRTGTVFTPSAILNMVVS